MDRSVFKQSLQSASHPDPRVHQEALDFLLTPRDENEWEHWRDFLAGAANVPAFHLHPLIMQTLLDLVCWIDGVAWGAEEGSRKDRHRVFGNARLNGKIRIMLRCLPPFLEKNPYPMNRLCAWGVLIPAHFRRRTRVREWKRRYRLFSRKIRERGKTPSESRAEVSLLEFSAVWRSPEKRHPFRKGRWLQAARNYVAPLEDRSGTGKPMERSPFYASSNRVFFPPHWRAVYPGYGKVLQRLVLCMAEELSAIRRLARRVSRCRRKVVVSLHNATLAAAGGWAFESLEAQFPDVRSWDAFQSAVKGRFRRFSKSPEAEKDLRAVDVLWERWEDRLLRPKFRHILWEMRGRAKIDPSFEEDFQKGVTLVRDWKDLKELLSSLEKMPYGWSGFLAPHQQLCLEDLLEWWREKRKGWIEGFFWFKAVVEEGGDWIRSGRLDALVVPWIDKFFISSLRTADLGYLVELFCWLKRIRPQPLLLFWEDTSRAKDPSLAVALRTAEEAFPFVGFGVFGDGRFRRDEAQDVLCRTAEPGVLYVLRPWADVHTPWSVERMMREDPAPFFRAYDSSWKDGIHVLYTGTQVAMLTSIATEPELYPSWLREGRNRVAFGSWIRRQLRLLVLGSGACADPKDALSRFLARWANLT